jgi:ubiquinone/menaquinone biosynthesis C-methylase UbiE
MSEQDKVFAGSIPEIYDRCLVPLIFEPYAADLARRMAAHAPSAVLETATGTGVVTRAAVPRLSAEAHYTATDLNPPMLDRARALQAPDRRLDWRQADALALPFADKSFDAVLCQFGVMFFPDRVRGYAEARRVLRPGGVFLFSTWDRIEVNEFADEVTRAVGLMFPDDPPRFLARTPHGYHDADQIRADLRAAGFARFEIESVAEVSRADGPRAPAFAYTQGTPLRNEIEARDATRLDEATDRAEAAIRGRFGTGAVESRIQAFVVTASA